MEGEENSNPSTASGSPPPFSAAPALTAGALQNAFSDEQLAQNERHIQELIKLIASGEAVALVGAGSSMSAGYSSWFGLIAQLEEQAKAITPPFVAGRPSETAREHLIRAQEIRDHIIRFGGGRQVFHDMLGKILARAEADIRQSLTPFHFDLVALPFRGILTTNYDPVIEYAFEAIYGPECKTRPSCYLERR